jgi:hypothetical protein
MSQQLINQCLNDLDRYKKVSGSFTEGVISEAFKDLLKAWARKNHFTFVNQYEFESARSTRIRPDLRVPLGYRMPTSMSSSSCIKEWTCRGICS